MPPRYLSTGLALLIDALAIAIVVAVLALAYWAVTGISGNYLAVFSNALFFAGGIILIFGAVIEFMHIKGTVELRKMLLRPRAWFDRQGANDEANVAGEDEEPEAGWLLIFVGALLVAFSIVPSLNYFI
jgi:hypothetical protein